MPVIVVDPEKCIGSGICRSVCPKGPRIWSVEKRGGKLLCIVVDPSFCLNCKLCVTRCPTGAIVVRVK